ncbi:peptidyl-prolyl cis-trans isomerase [Cohnella sp. WQ 127256]|uniref:peptidylprolyl isomerase n=1 Tax=Cohnella sp. WQ 127256 TaxID=2938790 RepID=UPI002118BAD2
MRETIRREPLVLLALLVTMVMTSSCQSSSSKPISGESSPKESVVESDVVATIGKSAISRQSLLDQLLSIHGSQTLRSMMLLIAVQEEADSLKIEVKEDELEQELSHMKQGYEDEEQFYKAMNELGMDRNEVREDARYRLLLEKISIHNVTVNPSEVDAYLEEHRGEFLPLKSYQLAKIVVQTKELADGLLVQLAAGEDFAELARQYSIDEFTADEGGELGWVEEQDPFEAHEVLEAVSSMQVGETTGPIQTDQGYVVVRLDGRSESQTMSEEDMRKAIQHQVALGKAVSLRDLEQSLLTKYNADVKEPSLNY